MSPDNRLIRNLGYETRVMKGYFGDPMGAHSLAFVINADADGRGNIDSVGNTIRAGRFGTEVEFNVSEYKCRNCNRQDYSLEFLIEGTQACRQGNFGQVEDL